jgi:hypothetical protein
LCNAIRFLEVESWLKFHDSKKLLMEEVTKGHDALQREGLQSDQGQQYNRKDISFGARGTRSRQGLKLASTGQEEPPASISSQHHDYTCSGKQSVRKSVSKKSANSSQYFLFRELFAG